MIAGLTFAALACNLGQTATEEPAPPPAESQTNSPFCGLSCTDGVEFTAGLRRLRSCQEYDPRLPDHCH